MTFRLLVFSDRWLVYLSQSKMISIFSNSSTYLLISWSVQYSWLQSHIGNKSKTPREREEEPIHGLAVVPFYHTTTNRLARILQWKNIQTIYYPLFKLSRHQVKDSLGLNIPGVYQILCDCQVCSEQVWSENAVGDHWLDLMVLVFQWGYSVWDDSPLSMQPSNLKILFLRIWRLSAVWTTGRWGNLQKSDDRIKADWPREAKLLHLWQLITWL